MKKQLVIATFLKKQLLNLAVTLAVSAWAASCILFPGMGVIMALFLILGMLIGPDPLG